MQDLRRAFQILPTSMVSKRCVIASPKRLCSDENGNAEWISANIHGCFCQLQQSLTGVASDEVRKLASSDRSFTLVPPRLLVLRVVSHRVVLSLNNPMSPMTYRQYRKQTV
ncbi:hypothetical protein CRM22_005322 [Opisthorchis felineus]|uniref:Uncharacterized protein n=1 Tax=Opisthorchis felineus TaxID=147828 RepID=A0A4S2LRR9_OPIFE|nr:hypothetical protein CRM22_005322 [Opisthorchis felineus]